MVQAPGTPETETLLIKLPKTIKLYITQEQFTALAAVNPDSIKNCHRAQSISPPLVRGGLTVLLRESGGFCHKSLHSSKTLPVIEPH